MSRFLNPRYSGLTPYVPGEQPLGVKLVKLNTNESPFPPAPEALRRAAEAAGGLQLYSDPDCRALTELAARTFGVAKDEIMFTNGSDEALNFAFMAFCGPGRPAVFPDITYGFYTVFADVNGIPYRQIPLGADFTVDVSDYIGPGQTVFLANPNAPTGLALPVGEIERVLKGNPDGIVVVDEAYVDFGTESALPLIHQYDNLLVVQTFSKSRSLAGARLGMAFGCADLIRDLQLLRNSTNPYNVNSVAQAAGYGALAEDAYFESCRQTICRTRDWTAEKLRAMGFEVTDSRTNFLFLRHPAISGGALYQRLREEGILVRHFSAPRVSDYNRVTVGSREQMEILLTALCKILEETA